MRFRHGLALLTAVTVSLCGCARTSDDVAVPSLDTTTTIPRSTTVDVAAVEVDGLSATATTINIGILADLSGPYSSGVVDVVDAQLAFWSELNDRGGIDGRQIEVMVEDTGYDTTKHLRAYHRLVDDVVMFSHSTGTPQTAAIADLLESDHRVAIPLTWYSGWTAPAGRNLIEIGSNYCIEAVNTLAYLAADSEDTLDLAVLTVPGDFGVDSARGLIAAADRLNAEVVLDASGALVADADLASLARSTVAADPDWIWLSADPSVAIQVVAAVTQFGYDGGWTGSSPTWNTRLLATQLGPLLGESVVIPSLVAPLGSDAEGMDEVYGILAERLPDRYPSEALVVGYLEFETTRRLLEAAISAGDLTPAGIERVANQVVGAGFDALSPAADDGQLVTATGVSRFSYETFSEQGGLAGTLAGEAVTPLVTVAGFDDYAGRSALDHRDVCAPPGRDD